MSICPSCGEDPCGGHARCRYPYTHHGPAVFGSKMEDFLISEANLELDDIVRRNPDDFADPYPETVDD